MLSYEFLYYLHKIIKCHSPSSRLLDIYLLKQVGFGPLTRPGPSPHTSLIIASGEINGKTQRIREISQFEIKNLRTNKAALG